LHRRNLMVWLEGISRVGTLATVVKDERGNMVEL
jgi:hypothetical protein